VRCERLDDGSALALGSNRGARFPGLLWFGLVLRRLRFRARALLRFQRSNPRARLLSLLETPTGVLADALWAIFVVLDCPLRWLERSNGCRGRIQKANRS
jgi:hypothetical protein